MPFLSRLSSSTVLAISMLSFGCAGSEPGGGGEPVGTDGPVDDDDGDPSDSDPTSDSNSTNPTDPTTDPTSNDETGGCGGCVDVSGVCQPGSFNEACGGFGEACEVCGGSTVCAEGECVEPPECNPSNCNGCCDGTTCVDGNDVGACGQNGGQCNNCPQNAACNGGVCELACADSCDGCCDGNTCIEFDAISEENCGVNGDVCQPCGNGFECIDGECLSTACIATCGGCCDGDECLPGGSPNACGSDGASCQECGLNTVCEATGCVPDPMALWDVEIFDGVLPVSDEDGDPWDAFNGLPDPYVEVEVVGMSGETGVEDNTVFPMWNEVVLEGVSTVQLQDNVVFTVWDSDAVFDQTVAECTVEIVDEMFDGGTWELTCSNPETEFEFWTITFALSSAG